MSNETKKTFVDCLSPEEKSNWYEIFQECYGDSINSGDRVVNIAEALYGVPRDAHDYDDTLIDFKETGGKLTSFVIHKMTEEHLGLLDKMSSAWSAREQFRDGPYEPDFEDDSEEKSEYEEAANNYEAIATCLNEAKLERVEISIDDPPAWAVMYALMAHEGPPLLESPPEGDLLKWLADVFEMSKPTEQPKPNNQNGN